MFQPNLFPNLNINRKDKIWINPKMQFKTRGSFHTINAISNNNIREAQEYSNGLIQRHIFYSASTKKRT